ncbi:thiol:disulfide interchange protein DsbA/DsbL [uncultured Psychrosphaera sp.]|uniref:thiol:disulfide interchange protein DsbA/DsbL n=1 Tax=uncultured Psychrosphaera sp. TaxID=1403522 RepID=UPI00263173CD|nr:thiol:disulfide interchange protein DsbA/DsbL [uncultured Psychrosphaera sp.]
MKKLITLVMAVFMAASVSAVELKEGVHYEVISTTATATPEVKEFFSYYCPHCHNFEPLADNLKKAAETDNFKFVKSHVDFLRAAGPDIQLMLTKALVTSELLNVPQVSKAIFEYIHVQRGVFTKEKDIRNIFLIHNVDGEKFDKAFNSFAVKAAASKMKKEQDSLSRRKVLTGVPTFIVNGKYKILNSGFKVKTYSELFAQLEDAAVQLTKKN